MKLYSKLYIKTLSVVVILTAALLSIGCGGGSSGNKEEPLDEITTLNYIKEAYTYTFPLVFMHLTRVKATNAMQPKDVVAPINQFSHADYISDANYGDASVPNIDVVCSQAFLDLNRDAVVFEKPDPDRFCLFELYDAYTNCVHTMGAGGQSNNSKYLITGPGFKDTVPPNMVQIKVPTNLAWLVGRIRCFGEDDIENVQKIQQNINSKELDLYLKNKHQPFSNYDVSNDFVPLKKLNSLGSEEYFNLANKLMIANPPTKEDSEILKRMKRVGVGPGLSFNPEILGPNGIRYFEEIKISMPKEWESNSRHFLFATPNYRKDTGLWNFYSYGIANFKTEYQYRAFCAYNYLCAHLNASCLTVFKYNDDDGKNEYLSGKYSYKLRFQPNLLPVLNNVKGFWSITVYNADTHRLITEYENNVFSINDKTDLIATDSGYIDVTLQPISSNVASSSQSVGSNVLPVCKGRFYLIMRVYLPHIATINGFWPAPIVTKLEDEEKKQTSSNK